MWLDKPINGGYNSNHIAIYPPTTDCTLYCQPRTIQAIKVSVPTYRHMICIYVYSLYASY